MHEQEETNSVDPEVNLISLRKLADRGTDTHFSSEQLERIKELVLAANAYGATADVIAVESGLTMCQVLQILEAESTSGESKNRSARQGAPDWLIH